MLRPFFSYFGGKWYAAPHYPKPKMPMLVEPFAGAAGYALRYPERDVVLIERSPVVAGLWRWLIATSADEIRALPLIDHDQTTADLAVCEEARDLIGFWCNKGNSSPCRRLSAWARDPRYANQFWGEKIRERVASQVSHIRHWTVIEGDYTQFTNVEATWFIDPPYQKMGKHYPFNKIDYSALSEWCQTRQGQSIVCENEGADWMEFRPFRNIKATASKTGGHTSREVIWEGGA